MPFTMIHNNIINMKTDIIVNAANEQLQAGGGVCGAIYKNAGVHELTQECQQYSPIKTGEAVLTKGYHLKSKYIVHAVGPIYVDGKHHEKDLLKKAYLSSLNLAIEHHCSSIAFPLLSAGIYGYPKKEALQVAVDTIKEFLYSNDLDVYLVLLDKEAIQINEDMYGKIQNYIDEYFEETRVRYNEFKENDIASYMVCEESLSSLLDRKEETFSQMLLRLIDDRELKDQDVYTKANIDRRHFSKIRNNINYNPSKKTVLQLAIALELSLDSTLDLLATAGYTFSLSQKSDIIIQYFIENEDYDIYKINETLFYFEEPTLI